MIRNLGVAIVAAASLGLAGSASATIHNLVYSGHVTEALDLTGEFGLPGGDLVGKSFKAFVTYDDAKPGATNTGGVYYDYYAGLDTTTPLTAIIKLNGVTMSFGVGHGAGSSGQDYRQDNALNPGCTLDCTRAEFQQNATDRFVDNGLYTLNYINLGGSSTDGTISGLAHTAPNYTNPPIDDLYAFVNVFQQNESTLESLKWAEVTAKIDSVGAGVPEPATWALMLGGFAGMGARLRRARRSALA